MKQALLICFFLSPTLLLKAQKAYIQVTGEPGLSVYLDRQFKGKTNAELNGYIIQDVTPGQHLIKIEKAGYAPYEENITVKSGEVFAYKVKPFTKHVVVISQEGNSGETDKKAAIRTGKLIIQSLPIDIRLTIPQIEGVNNTAKTKDQWIADAVPEGTYKLNFTFNGKTISKDVQVDGDNTTQVFINMLSGEFTAKSTLDENVAIQRAKDKEAAYVKKLAEQYKFKANLSLTQFLAYNPAVRPLLEYQSSPTFTSYTLPHKIMLKKPDLIPGFTSFAAGYDHWRDNYKKVWILTYTFMYTKDFNAAKAAYDKLNQEMKENTYYLLEEKVRSSYLSTTRYGFEDIELKLELDSNNEGYYKVDFQFRVR